jgi:hypothetical protein
MLESNQKLYDTHADKPSAAGRSVPSLNRSEEVIR